MPLDKFIVIIFGAAGIFFTHWFFLMKKDRVVDAEGSIDILVDGGYSPGTISIPEGRTTTLNFLYS